MLNEILEHEYVFCTITGFALGMSVGIVFMLSEIIHNKFFYNKKILPKISIHKKEN